MRCAAGGGDGGGAVSGGSGKCDGTSDGAWRGTPVQPGKADGVQAYDHRRD